MAPENRGAAAQLAFGLRSRLGETLPTAGVEQLAAGEGDGHELGTGVSPQLRHRMFYMSANCRRGDEEVIGDALRLLP